MIDGTGFVDSEKKKNKKRKESIAQLRLKGSPLHVQTQPYLRPFVVELTKTDKKKYQTLPSDYFWDLCCHISSLSHSWFPVMKFSLCLFFFFALSFEGLILFIDLSLIFISFFLFTGQFFHRLLSDATPSTEDIVPKVDRTTLLYSSLLVCYARRKFCLKPSLFSLTVLPVNSGQTHCILGMPNVLQNKHFARISFASSSF